MSTLRTETDYAGEAFSVKAIDDDADCFCLTGMCERVAWNSERPEGATPQWPFEAENALLGELHQVLVSAGFRPKGAQDDETAEGCLILFNDSPETTFKQIRMLTSRAAETYRQRYEL